MQINLFWLIFGESKCILYQDINSQICYRQTLLIWKGCGTDCMYLNLQTKKGEQRHGCASDSWYVVVCKERRNPLRKHLSEIGKCRKEDRTHIKQTHEEMPL